MKEGPCVQMPQKGDERDGGSTGSQYTQKMSFGPQLFGGRIFGTNPRRISGPIVVTIELSQLSRIENEHKQIN